MTLTTPEKPFLQKAVIWKNRMIVAGFAAVLLVFFVWCLVKPADDVSISERRPLAQRPEAVNGRFAEQFEAYSRDQFPMRETFRRIKAFTALKVMGQKDNHGVYKAGGHLSKTEYPMDEASIENAGKHFGKVYEKYLKGRDVNVYFSVIPDKNAFLAKEYRYPAMDYEAFTALAREQMDFAEYIDIVPLLSIEDYYVTDTHWRQENIVDAAQALLDAMAVRGDAGPADPVSEDGRLRAIGGSGDPASRDGGEKMTGVSLAGIAFEKKKLEQPFYGVFAGQFGMKTAGEELYYLDSRIYDDCVVYDYETNRNAAVYDREKAAGKDPYELFLSGPKSLLTIENPHAENDRHLILFRDSFGSSIAPLLIPAYGKVTLIDIRYIRTEYLEKFVEFDGSDVLFLYSTSVLNHSEVLK